MIERVFWSTASWPRPSATRWGRSLWRRHPARRARLAGTGARRHLLSPRARAIESSPLLPSKSGARRSVPAPDAPRRPTWCIRALPLPRPLALRERGRPGGEPGRHPLLFRPPSGSGVAPRDL